MQTITAVIPAKNEEKNIARCIESLKWCDRIVVIWMGNDQTGEIARKMGAEVYTRSSNTLRVLSDFRQVQKNINWAIDHCTTDWMIRIDADEVVTPELKEEIISILKSKIPNPNFQTNSKFKFPNSNFIENFKLKIENYPVAYGIPRKQYFLGAFLKGGDWAYDRLVRLFRPKYARYEPVVTVHEQFKVNGKVGYLKNKLLHYSHPTFKDTVKKFQKYADIQIVDITDNYAAATLKMFVLPVYIFLRWMIWHHGYRDGIRGMVAGAMRGWYEYLLYSKYLFKKRKK